MGRFFKAFNRFSATFEKIVTTFLMGAILAIGTTQVIMRYVLNNSLSWSEELMRYMFIWMVFIGSAVTFRNNAHITIDFFTSLLSKKARMILFYISKSLIIIALLVLIPAGIELALRSITSLSGALQLSRFWVYLSIPAGAIFMLNSIISCLITQPYQDEAQHNIIGETSEQNEKNLIGDMEKTQKDGEK